MMYKIYYFIHFGVIFIISFIGTIYTYKDYKNISSYRLEKASNFIKNLINNPVYHCYAILTGTNTGYGFYGINVATYKFFKVELYDMNGNILKTIITFDIKNQNNLARFEILASRMANYVVENKNYPKNGNKKILRFRKEVVRKIFKQIGLYEAKKQKNCKYYITTLYTLQPINIWETKHYNKLKTIGAYESFKFKSPFIN